MQEIRKKQNHNTIEQNTLAVSKFIIHNDVNKTLRSLRSKCRQGLLLKRVRVSYSLVCILALIFMFMGYMNVSPVLMMSAGLALCVLTVCFYSLVDLRYGDISLSYSELKDAYDKISMTSFKDYDSMYDEDSLRELLPGIKLMNILYEHTIHHVSVTKDGNLAFIYEHDSIQISSSVYVDTSQIRDTSSKVNIIVDACYIKAIPA